MTFLKFGITSNHLANSFSSDLIPHVHGSSGGLILVTPLMLTVRWSIEVPTHLTLMIPLIFPIQSTVLNNVHLCSQLSWCTEIMHGQQTGGLKGSRLLRKQTKRFWYQRLYDFGLCGHILGQQISQARAQFVRSSVLLHKTFLWPRWFSHPKKADV